MIDPKYRAKALGPRGWRNCNLHSHLGRLVEKAGLERWPRLLHNMRASRQTELEREHPLHVVCSWLGNTPRIAERHYLQVRPEDFDRAVKGGARIGAVDAEKGAQNQAQRMHADQRNVARNEPQPVGESADNAPVRAIPRLIAINTSGEDRIRTCGPVSRSRI